MYDKNNYGKLDVGIDASGVRLYVFGNEPAR